MNPHEQIQAGTELPSEKRRVVIAGASGMIGEAVAARLAERGHVVIRLVRGRVAMPGEVAWEPAYQRLDTAALERCDAVVNLSGENVGAGRWTKRRRERILASRIDATRTLVGAMRSAERGPRILVNASAVGYYGERGDEWVTENSASGVGFLAEVCRAWEETADEAVAFGTRVARLRLGVVLAVSGGALAKLLPVFRLGVGGRIGTGRQWMSWISLADAASAIVRLVEDSTARGAFNGVAPQPVTNAEFTETLGRVLRRPTIMRVPAFALRLAMGEMAEATVLASTRAAPAALVSAGFQFQHETLDAALRDTLS